MDRERGESTEGSSRKRQIVNILKGFLVEEVLNNSFLYLPFTGVYPAAGNIFIGNHKAAFLPA